MTEKFEKLERCDVGWGTGLRTEVLVNGGAVSVH